MGETDRAILYVDDQPSHRTLFERSFRSDCLVLTASSADEGLEILRTHQVFLVIADYSMPGKTGVDFLEEARAVSPQTVRAILSAYSDPSLVRDALKRAQVAQYLRKPWKREEVRQFIESAFRQFSLPPATGEAVARRSITQSRICDLLESVEPSPDPRQRRRILLNHVLPSLKETVALIVRPSHPLLQEALQMAIQGNIEEMEKALVQYLREDLGEGKDPPVLLKH